MSGPQDAIWNALESSGANSLIRRRRRGHLLIVCYHGICDDACSERHWLLVRRCTFARQLDYLQARFHILPLDEAIAQLRAGRLTEPTAAITFDDGYRNNYSFAWPELRARGLPSTIFLVTGLISTPDTIWTTRLEYAVRKSGARGLDLRPWGGASLAFEPGRTAAQAGYAIKEWLKDQPARARREILRDVLSPLQPTAPSPIEFSLLSWEEVRELASTGLVRFGAHTVHHEILSQLDDADLEAELTTSVQAVAALGAGSSRVFAYPNGRKRDFDERAQRVLDALGIEAAVTTIPGTNSGRTPPLALRRLVVDERMSSSRFASEAGGVAAVARAISRGWLVSRQTTRSSWAGLLTDR